MTRDPENTKYGRCEATSKTTGKQCGRAAIDERGKCGYHGGKTPLENGIYSDVVRDEDEKVLDALEEISTEQKLEETLNLQLMKLRRAVELTENPDEERDFWGMFQTLVDSAADGGELDASMVRELSGMLQAAPKSQNHLMDLIRKTAKDLHKIRDGEKVKHEHGVDDEGLEEIRKMVDDAY